MKSLLIPSLIIGILIPSSLQTWSYRQQDNWPWTCQTGQQQSPINLEAKSLDCTDFETFDLKLNDSAKMQFVYQDDMWVAVSNDSIGYFEAEAFDDIVQTYSSHSFNLHTYSEHTINGQRSDMELQLVFELDKEVSPSVTDHSKAIISVLFDKVPDEANTNEFMKAVDVLYLEDQDDSGYTLNIKMNQLIGQLLVDKQNYIMYQGSKTIPNCDEVVNWYVVEKPIKIKDDELEIIQETYLQNNSYPITGNARELQAVNGRKIQKICEVTSRIESLFQNPSFYFLSIWIILCYLFWRFYGEIESDDYDDTDSGGSGVRDYIWTIHPIVSIIKVPNKKAFSRQCRIALLYVTWTIQMVTECIAFRIEGYYQDISCFYFAIIGILVSIPVTYMVGFWFRMYSKLMNENQRLMHFDGKSLEKYKKLFKVASLSIIIGGIVFLYWEIAYLVGILGRELIFSFILGIVFDLGILDVIVVNLSQKSETLGGLFKLRGYYYDGDISFYNILGGK